MFHQQIDLHSQNELLQQNNTLLILSSSELSETAKANANASTDQSQF